MSDPLPVPGTPSLPCLFGSQFHSSQGQFFTTQPRPHPHFRKGRSIVKGSDRSASETSSSLVATNLYKCFIVIFSATAAAQVSESPLPDMDTPFLKNHMRVRSLRRRPSSSLSSATEAQYRQL